MRLVSCPDVMAPAPQISGCEPAPQKWEMAGGVFWHFNATSTLPWCKYTGITLKAILRTDVNLSAVYV